jgi:hypothetical protein
VRRSKPTPPVRCRRRPISATHERYRDKLAEVVKPAKAGDVKALRRSKSTRSA